MSDSAETDIRSGQTGFYASVSAESDRWRYVGKVCMSDSGETDKQAAGDGKE